MKNQNTSIEGKDVLKNEPIKENDDKKQKLTQLKSEKLKIEREMAKLIKEAKNDSLKEILDLMSNSGLTAEEVIDFLQKKKIKPAKYVHPETGKKWTGAGRQPLWIKDWIESGKPLADLEQ